MKTFNGYILVQQPKDSFIDEVDGVLVDNGYEHSKSTNVVVELYYDGGILEGVKTGDTIIVSWLSMHQAYTNDGYQVKDGDTQLYAIPSEDVIAVVDDGYRAIGNWVLFFRKEDEYENYDMIPRGVKMGEVSNGVTQDGRVIMYESLWGLPLEDKQFRTLNKPLYYIEEDKILLTLK
jgi:hypothetical protein